jgi:hypothetical protein
MERITHSRKYQKSKSKIITWWLKSAIKSKSPNDSNILTSSNSTIILMTKLTFFWFYNWLKDNSTVNSWEMAVLMKSKPKEWPDRWYLLWSIFTKIKSFIEISNPKIFCLTRKIT